MNLLKNLELLLGNFLNDHLDVQLREKKREKGGNSESIFKDWRKNQSFPGISGMDESSQES